MIIEIPDENSIVKWKNDDKDEWKSAEISDLIQAYEMPKVTVFAENASKEEIVDFKQELEKVLERPQGEWVKKHVTFGTCTLQGYECNCGRVVMQRENFCPECGADMRGKDNGKL